LIGRLQRRSDFARLTEEGTYVRFGGLWCRMVTDSRLDAARVGYAIGRSFGGAVQRNRMRRRLRVLIAARSLQFRPGLYLVGAQPALLTASSDDLGVAVTGLLHQIEKHYA
jgi:ribonuclease P protein component